MTRPVSRPCVFCATPLGASDGTGVCSAIDCQWRARITPATRRCQECDRPLPPDQLAIRVCRHRDCETKANQRKAARRAAEAEALRARVLRRRRRQGARLGMSEDTIERFAAAVTPRNTARVSRLPAHRREAFLAHLREQLAVLAAEEAGREAPAVRDHGLVPVSPWPREQPAPLEPELQQLLWSACATCRGSCCRLGAQTQAFLTANTLRGYRKTTPGLDDDAMVEAYRARLPERTLTDGCVFQGERGCVLPREMRAPICNAFLCTTLRQLVAEQVATPPERPLQGAYLVHLHGRRLQGGRFALPILPAEAAPPT